MANAFTRFFTRFGRSPLPKNAPVTLRPVSAYTPQTVTPETRELGQRLVKRAERVKAAREAAAIRARRLPSARPGRENMTTADIAGEEGGNAAPKQRAFFSKNRLKNEEAIRELAAWEPLATDDPQAAVESAGLFFKRQVLALLDSLEALLPADHRTRELRAVVSSLDGQAFFILESNGYRDRLAAVIGDVETGQISTDKLLNSLFADQTAGDAGSIAWGALVEEARNARRYNRRRMGKL